MEINRPAHSHSIGDRAAPWAFLPDAQTRSDRGMRIVSERPTYARSQ